MPVLNTCVGCGVSLGTGSFVLELGNRVLTYQRSSFGSYLLSIVIARKTYRHLFEVEAPCRFVSQCSHFVLAHTSAEQHQSEACVLFTISLYEHCDPKCLKELAHAQSVNGVYQAVIESLK